MPFYVQMLIILGFVIGGMGVAAVVLYWLDRER